jgi:chitin deacetylase
MLSDSPPGTTPSAISSKLKKWLAGPKTPGLMILEHDLSAKSVQAFIDAYPAMKSNGWDIRSVPDAFDSPWYFNAATSNATVVADMSPAMTSQLSVASASALAAASSSSAAMSSPSAGSHKTNPATMLSTPLSAMLFTLLTLLAAL